MRVANLYLKLVLMVVLIGGVHLIAQNVRAQDLESLRPDLKRALAAQQSIAGAARQNGYSPTRSASTIELRKPGQSSETLGVPSSRAQWSANAA